MAGVRQKAGRKWWYALIPSPSGGRVERKLDVPVTASKRKAKAAADRLEKRLLREGKAETASRAVLTLDQVLTALREERQRSGRRSATIEVIDAKADRLIDHFGEDFNVHDLTLDLTTAYLDARLEGVPDTPGPGGRDRRAARRHTVAKELGVLRSALRLARRRKVWTGEPADLMPDAIKGAYKPVKRWVTPEEARQLRAVLVERFRPHFDLAIRAGLRRGEIWASMPEDIDHAAKRIRVREETKTGERWVPLDPVAYDAAKKLAAAKREAAKLTRKTAHADPHTFNNALRRAVQALNRQRKADGLEPVAPVSPNDLRRSFTSWCANGGVPELAVIRMMGHKSSKMVREVYAQLAEETERKAIEAMSVYAGDVADYAQAAEDPRRGLRSV